jgi:glycyl-tRNA synthetase alpha subunit
MGFGQRSTCLLVNWNRNARAQYFTSKRRGNRGNNSTRPQRLLRTLWFQQLLKCMRFLLVTIAMKSLFEALHLKAKRGA